jgi:hypothetical protein
MEWGIFYEKRFKYVDLEKTLAHNIDIISGYLNKHALRNITCFQDVIAYVLIYEKFYPSIPIRFYRNMLTNLDITRDVMPDIVIIWNFRAFMPDRLVPYLLYRETHSYTSYK